MEYQTKTSITTVSEDWDLPILTEQDLAAIDAATAAALSAPPIRKRHVEEVILVEKDSESHSPPKSKARRRLPDSLFSSSSYRSSMRKCSNNPRSFFQGIKFGGRILYSKTVEEVERAATELLNFVEAKKNEEGQCILGFDIEWRPTFRKGVAPGKAAVMQICGDKNYCHVLHIMYSGIPKSLRRLLEDRSSIKVGVGIAGDSSKLYKDYSVSVQNVGDLSDLANRKFSGKPKIWSLSNLSEAVICKQLPKPKKIQLGNWEVDSLSKEQLNYAATDAYISWYLYQVLTNLPDPDDKRRVETEIAPIDLV